MSDKRENRTIVISNDINRDVAKTVIEKIAEYNNSDRDREEKEINFKPIPITLVVNSYGGSCTDGFAIIGAITTSKTPVITVCLGKAMSMGLAIFASGHHRVAHSMSLFIYHQVSGGSFGKIEELKENTEYLSKLQEIYDNLMLKRTNITKDKLDDVKAKRIDWLFTPDDAVKYGVADEVVE